MERREEEIERKELDKARQVTLKVLIDEIKGMREETIALRAEIKPVIDVFTTLRTIGKWTAILVAFVGSITAIGVGVRTFFHK